MATSSIPSLVAYNTESLTDNFQKFQQEFQQLGQDLQSGNLSGAQQDFVTLQQLAPQNSSTTSSQNDNPIEQEFNQLSQDLQSGNLSGAQQDYSQIQQDFQSQAQAAQGHHHHHHGGSSTEQSQISQLFSQLGLQLQSGNLSGAQQAYATLQQEFSLFGQNTDQTSAPPTMTSNAVSLSA